jgi:ABC-type uncharacterized transport system substrate-binding protein
LIKKLFFFIFIFTNLAFGHPHTFIELFSNIKKENNNIVIHIKWIFDEMTSQMIIMDFDMNKNFVFDKEDKEYIYQEAFKHLNEFSYYGYLSANNKEFSQKAKNFDTSIKDNKVVYEFDYILDSSYINKNLSITFKDEDMFMAFVVKPNSFTSQNGIKTKLTEIKNEYYFGYKLEIIK